MTGEVNGRAESVEEMVLAYFRDRIDLPADRSVALAVRYTDHGYLDSMGVLNAVLAFEAEFDISFTDEQMAAPEFETIGGLIAMIQTARDGTAGR